MLVDLDDICISNTDRQLHMTSSSIGQMKLDEMKRRLNDINPHCNVTLIHNFVSGDVYEILDSCTDITALCDCITALCDCIEQLKREPFLQQASIDMYPS